MCKDGPDHSLSALEVQRTGRFLKPDMHLSLPAGLEGILPTGFASGYDQVTLVDCVCFGAAEVEASLSQN